MTEVKSFIECIKEALCQETTKETLEIMVDRCKERRIIDPLEFNGKKYCWNRKIFEYQCKYLDQSKILVNEQKEYYRCNRCDV